MDAGHDLGLEPKKTVELRLLLAEVDEEIANHAAQRHAPFCCLQPRSPVDVVWK
jgi:hypothetical protein